MPDPQFLNRTPVTNDPVGSLVGEFMEEKRKEQTEEKARAAFRRRNPRVVPLLVALCLVVWVAPSLMATREPPLSSETLERSARLTLYLASIRVKNHLAAHQRLPENLVQAGVDSTGIEYSRSTDSAFELATRVQGARMVYRSSLPDSVFLGPNLHVRGIS